MFAIETPYIRAVYICAGIHYVHMKKLETLTLHTLHT